MSVMVQGQKNISLSSSDASSPRLPAVSCTLLREKNVLKGLDIRGLKTVCTQRHLEED